MTIIAPIERIRNTAELAAQDAGKILLKHYGKPVRIDVVQKHDLKSEVDRLCEQAIIETIQSQFPDHAIITEEQKSMVCRSEYVWVVDPLDGTVNFCHGLPHFGVCVACYCRRIENDGDSDSSQTGLAALGKPLVGVVYAPVMNELFVGTTGEPATCNGKAIRVGKERELSEAVVSVSYGSTEEAMQRMEKVTAGLIRNVRKVRIFGSTGLDMVNVACGRISGVLQDSVRNWDFAAARVILEQSGGIFDAYEQSDNHWKIIACAPGLYTSLKKLTIRT
jgi:fructose-1,6-bisphosphatase/inositol monophosphatase family enzyme